MNFLDKSAREYLEVVKKYLEKAGQKADKPLAFLCNPPYRNDDDQTATNKGYQIHPSIIELKKSSWSKDEGCSMLFPKMLFSFISRIQVIKFINYFKICFNIS